MLTWGLHPWVPEMKCEEDDYICADNDEALLITMVIGWFAEYKPDILTGWYTEGFDNPYFVNRAFKIVGDLVKKMSPWGIVRLQEKEYNGKPELNAIIEGIVSLDYQDLYKKFSPDKHESYKLDFIGNVELGRYLRRRNGTCFGGARLKTFSVRAGFVARGGGNPPKTGRHRIR